MGATIYILLIIMIMLPISAAVYIHGRGRKYLVFSSVGDRNQVNTWLNQLGERHFDLVIYYYGDDPEPDIYADILVKRKGLKFENFKHFLDRNSIKHYRAIWVVDDDIIMDTESINKMFRVFNRYGLSLAQPSFSKGSKVSWPLSVKKPDSVLRFTNFVENGVSIFSRDVIPLFLESFSDAGTGYGVDYIWPSLLKFDTSRIAVIDYVSCSHPARENSSLDEVVPRHLHMLQGAELLKTYGLLPDSWAPTRDFPWPKPYKRKIYSAISKQSDIDL